MAVVALGGHVGSLVARELHRANVPFERVKARGATRQNFSVIEAGTGQQFRFVHDAEPMTKHEWTKCLDATVRLGARESCVVATGSVPHGVPDDVYAQLAARLRGRVHLIVDTHGAALRACLDAPIDIVKPSDNELGELAGMPTGTVEECDIAARLVLATSQWQAIVVSCGRNGALWVPRSDPSVLVVPPRINAISTIGAGDSLVAGLALAGSRGISGVEAVRLGVAAGSAAVLNAGAALCTRADTFRLLAAVTARPLHEQLSVGGVDRTPQLRAAAK